MTVHGVTDLTTFVVGTIFIVLLPGPNSLYVMTASARHGAGAGLRAASGIVVGDTILMLLTATGAASVLYASPTVFTVMKLAGALYLLWLGIGLLRSAAATWRFRRAPEQQHAHASRSKQFSLRRPFHTALAISLLNPKAILFFVSFFVQFVDPQAGSPALAFFILGVIVQAISIAYLLALIYGGTRLASSVSSRPWLAAGSTTVVGLLFIGFALRLAL